MSLLEQVIALIVVTTGFLIRLARALCQGHVGRRIAARSAPEDESS
jgi:hypothetical protein